MANKRTKNRSKKNSQGEDFAELENPSLPDEQELLRQSDRFTNMMLAIFGGVGLLLSLVAVLMAWNIHRKTPPRCRFRAWSHN